MYSLPHPHLLTLSTHKRAANLYFLIISFEWHLDEAHSICNYSQYAWQSMHGSLREVSLDYSRHVSMDDASLFAWDMIGGRESVAQPTHKEATADFPLNHGEGFLLIECVCA